MARLTKRRIEAIRTALGFYLAGEPNDGDELNRKDYEAALDWAVEQFERKTSKKTASNSE